MTRKLKWWPHAQLNTVVKLDNDFYIDQFQVHKSDLSLYLKCLGNILQTKMFQRLWGAQLQTLRKAVVKLHKKEQQKEERRTKGNLTVNRKLHHAQISPVRGLQFAKLCGLELFFSHNWNLWSRNRINWWANHIIPVRIWVAFPLDILLSEWPTRPLLNFLSISVCCFISR